MMSEKIREFIAKSCMAMDEERFDDYLTLCSGNYRYRILTFSPDIGREMTWLDLDAIGMHALLNMVPQHVRLQGKLRRHASLYTHEERPDHVVSAVSSLIVSHTGLDGETKIFASGQLQDRIAVEGDELKLVSRDVLLDTRVFGPGSHVPI